MTTATAPITEASTAISSGVEAVVADAGTVEDGGTHADQRVRTDRAAVDDGMVADRAALSDRDTHARIGVHHDPILDIAASPDDDRVIVATQHGSEPDADVLAEAHVSDDLRIRRCPEAVSSWQLRNTVTQAVDRHLQSAFSADAG